MRYNMNRFFITTLIVFLSAVSVNSQSDPVKKSDIVIYTNDASCYINREIKANDLSLNTQGTRIDSFYIGNINRIIFLEQDSLVVRKRKNHSYGFNIDDLREVSVKSGSNGLLGFCLGFLTGGLIGIFIAPQEINLTGRNHYNFSIGPSMPDYTTFGAAFLGGIVFGAIGALIGSSIDDYETLNLLSLPDKDKKSKLIKFLKQNR